MSFIHSLLALGLSCMPDMRWPVIEPQLVKDMDGRSVKAPRRHSGTRAAQRAAQKARNRALHRSRTRRS